MALQVVDIFRTTHQHFDSSQNTLPSNSVLAHVAAGLQDVGFRVEVGAKFDQKVYVPVLYGNNGKVDKAFHADAHHVEGRFVVEIEAGRATINNQFLKDLFQACMMDDVEYLAIAVRNLYAAANVKSPDFDRVVMFFDTLYASTRMQLPLKGVLIIGY